MTVELFLGGARSGKSSYAEQAALSYLAEQGRAARLHYIATAIAFDDEMRKRIAHHQSRRGAEWHNHECPVALAQKVAQLEAHDIVLIDCLTLWINNVIYNDGNTATPTEIRQQVEDLVEVLDACAATILCVSNEVGLGIVPLGEVSRLYVDHAGWMNQAIAKVASRVTFMAAGLPLILKDSQVDSTTSKGTCSER
ncbi:adenosylcobinamide kinase /adenosylcobinamide-phosphate guanylyltransferase [Vibrio xiamenensis]|uniref:Bifunctional adenosylcobalamin biosynthesis protein n=1 Tax=Vibrio xiamenensis TaxID=861298 RepID=A0A1G7YAI5_9VIBR|nr:bifunctional adenosylcobinamide kinase/adenosylcobinamide-phosphate guanylyltransferase [Vibrio xiamenensis]SDG93346.1 adenosylcobinamide kinase /adenosylcobinamide-phosphate guanylyltransferase [Vibrio xiamenensis]